MKAWAESMGGISFPLLSDFWPHGEVSKKYGVLREEGVSERAVFVIDRHGCIQYQDIHDIDDLPDNEEIFKVLRQIEPEAAAALPQVVEKKQEIPEHSIVMYCTRWCPDCEKARAWFAKKGLEVFEISVDEDKKAAQKMREWADGNLTTPTIDFDGIIIVDYQEDELERALLQRPDVRKAK